MTRDEPTDPGDQMSRELTPEEAREKRARYLALYRSYTETERKTEADDVDATDPTVAAFILPGGD
jgi:hypothetical protein